MSLQITTIPITNPITIPKLLVNKRIKIMAGFAFDYFSHFFNKTAYKIRKNA